LRAAIAGVRIIDLCDDGLCMEEAVIRVHLQDDDGRVLKDVRVCETHLQEIRKHLNARPADWPKYTLDELELPE
jgi:hypothetical protein